MTRFLIWPADGPAANAEDATLLARMAVVSARRSILEGS